MSLTYCEECCAIEQGTIEIEEDGETYEVCASCTAPGVKSIPEHDDGDFER